MEPGQVELDWKTYGAELGRRCRLLRERVRITQSQLADRAGVSRTYVQALERGYRSAENEEPVNVSLRVLYGLAYALRVPPVCLLPDGEREVGERSVSVQESPELEEILTVDVAWPVEAYVECG